MELSQNKPHPDHNKLVCVCILCTLWRATGRTEEERNIPILENEKCDCLECIEQKAIREYEETECRCYCHNDE